MPRSTPAPTDPAAPRRRGRWVALLLLASLALNVLLLGAGTTFVAKKGGMLYLKQTLGLKRHEIPVRGFQLQQAATYRALPVGPHDTVFLGDSLTAAAPFADVFSDIKNRGIGGDTSGGLLTRLDDVLVGRPERLFLMIGANDIANEVPAGEIVDNVRTILRRARRDSPGTKLFVESVLPVNQEMVTRIMQAPLPRNPRVRELNPRLRELAQAEGATYIDLTPAMADPTTGELPADFTSDGLHLSLKGQLAMLDALRPHVATTRPAGN